MATKEEADKWLGEGGGADYGYEINGQDVWMSQASPESWKAVQDAATKNTPLYYKKDSNDYTNKISEADLSRVNEVSIDIDRGANKVNIKAPESVLNSEPFKQSFGSDQFKSLAKSYIDNPNNELTLTDGTKKTANDLMNDYKEALNQIAEQRVQFNLIAKDQEKYYGLTGLNDQQKAIANSWVDNNSKKTDVVYLPTKVVGGFDFSQYDSYNDDGNIISISKEDFDKFNQSRAFDDEHVKKAREEAMAAIRTLAQAKQDENYEYDDAGKWEAVRWQSFFNSLEHSTTDVSAPVAIANFIEGGVHGFGQVFTSLADNTGKLAENIGSGLYYINPMTGAGLQSVGKSLQGLAAVGDMFDNILYTPDANAEDMFSRLFTDLKDISGIDISDDERNKIQEINVDLTQNIQLRHDMAGALGAGELVGSLAGEALKQIVLVNPIGNAIGSGVRSVSGAALAIRDTSKTINGLSNMTKLVSKFGTTEQLGNLAQTALNLTRSATVLSVGQEVGVNVLGKMADVAVQGIADTILTDSEALNKLYSSGETAGLANELVNNMIWNAIGEVGAFGGSKAVEAIGETKTGKVIQLGFGKATNELAALKNQAKLAVENRLGKFKLFKDQIGAGTRVFQEEIIDLEKQAAKAKTLDEFNDAIKKRINLENEYDNIIKGPRIEAAKMVSSPVLGKSYKAYNESSTKLSSAIVEKGGKVMPGSKVSREVADYLSIKVHLQRALSDVKTVDSKWAKSLQDRFDTLSKQLADKGLLEIANENYNRIADLTKQLTDYKINNHILNAADIEGMRNTGYWGKEGEIFFHTKKLKDGIKEATDTEVKTALGDYQKTLSDNGYRKFHANEAKNYKLTQSEVDSQFIDPNVIIEADFYATAKEVQGKRWGDALLNANGVKKVLGEVKELGTESKAVKNLSELQQKIYSNVRKTAAGDYELVLDDLFPEVRKARKAVGEQANKLATDRTKAAKTYNKAVDTYTGMQLDGNDIAEIEVGLGGRYGIPDFNPDNLSANSFQSMVDSLDNNTKKLLQQQIDNVAGKGAALTLDNYKLAYSTIEDVDLGLRRSFINNSTKIKETKTYKDTIRRVRKANDDFRDAAFLDKYQTKYDAIVAKYSDLRENPFALRNGGKQFKDDVKDMVQGIQENWVARIKDTEGSRQLLKTLIDEGLDEDTAIQYLVVDTLNNMRLDKADRPLQDSIMNYLQKSNYYDGISSGELKEFSDIIADMSNEIIESEWNIMTRSLIDNGYEDLVDLDKVFSRVQEYADDILGTAKDDSRNIIQILNSEGKLVYVETDPIVKDLYQWRPNYADSTPNLFFSLTNRIFKTATSGVLSVKSLFTQGVKDPINTYVAGGAVPFLNRGMSRFFGGDAYGKISESIVESLEGRVTTALKQELGKDGWALFEQEAKAQGKSVGRAAVEYELITRPQAIAGVGGTETKFYQEMSHARMVENAYEYGGVVSDNNKASKFTQFLEDKLRKIEDVHPANARETYLCNVVYGEQFQQAIAKGRSVDEARAIAERFMVDATTNFGRPLAMGNRIARSIPYLNAAFNGKASFMRLLELDPAGVTGRFFGGVILPYMSLLAESLGKEGNAEVYKNIPESDKEGNLVFVVDGTALSIPVPEELAIFIAPFRQAVEKMNDANDHSWAELVANDLLQLPVMDLSGFYDIDQNELTNNTTFWGSVGRGFEKLIFGQMSPAIVKSTYMAISGRDPYYGTEIDRSYVYQDDENGVQVMDSNDNKIATTVSSWAKKVGINLSPSAAYSILGTTFGKGLLNLGDSIGSLLSGESASFGDRTISGVAGIFLDNVRDRGADQWREAVNMLYDNKEKLMHSEEYQKIVQNINNKQLSEDKRQEYISQLRTYTQDFTNSVVSAANEMKKRYGLNVNQQASVISLLTFADNTTPAFNANARDTASENFYTARSLAIETLNNLGFDGANDLSIFGYGTYVTNYATGDQEYKYKYNTPMDILDMGNIVWGQADITLANIKQEIEGNSGIKNDYNAFYQERSKLYDQASSEKDKTKKKNIYAQIDSLNEQWSNRVMRAIVPYIDEYGLDGLLNNREVISYLEKYIQVPSNLMGQAKYMSQSKTGLDKNAGFAQSYMKKWYELYQKEKGAK